VIPLGDETPRRITPLTNWTIIGLCVLIFLWQISSGDDFFISTLFDFGVVPAKIAAGEGYISLITSMFLHGGWTHLIGNMFFLYIFGDNVEDAYGHFGYLAFYLGTGIIASVVWTISEWGSNFPAVGASGAISGVMAAYFVLFPQARIRTLVRFGFIWQIMRISASTMIGLWFVYQLMLAILSIDAGVAYLAHIGGFVSGIIIAKIFKPRGLMEPARYR
jgi:membrane associated rhomboid family serine protease